MSARFEAAAAYLAKPSTTSKPPSTSTKLSLYAHYKYVTSSPRPTAARPGMLDWTGRAKWDAWDNLGKELGPDAKETAEERYCDLAKQSGWEESSEPTESTPRTSQRKEEEEDIDLDRLDEDEEEPAIRGSGDAGLGISVSTMSMADTPSKECASTPLHEAVVSGDLEVLRAALEKQDTGVDVVDGFGYTPLHLAVDRGSLDAVKLLLEKGAKVDLKDQDDMTPREMAEILGHEQIEKLLASR
ncbi:ankyrin [Cylindrobasidium torrendii FP15055 ss-10]|uniref:Ankyrin n=1 Tax=Cylindrobasidium torrendii FP15055 ss-10 TaxID=1314674 RepID=A0A0D7BKJ9_9AGAR|nr:ankyrin [Cylindrobasidium torrendii FP15055 ss-10]